MKPCPCPNLASKSSGRIPLISKGFAEPRSRTNFPPTKRSEALIPSILTEVLPDFMKSIASLNTSINSLPFVDMSYG